MSKKNGQTSLTAVSTRDNADLESLRSPSSGAPVYGTTVTLRLSQLNSDPFYQRTLKKRLVKDIAENFKAELFAALLINQRPDESYWTVDGQHRVTGLRARDPLFDHQVGCHVVRVGGQAEEAALFSLYNHRKTRNALQHAEHVTALLLNHDPRWSRIDEIVRETGFSLQFVATPAGGRKNWRMINQTATLEYIFRYDEQTLRSTLQFIDRAWPGAYNSTCRSVLLGIATFMVEVEEHKGMAKGWEPVADLLSGLEIEALRKRAKERTSDLKGGQRLAEDLIREYNQRRPKNKIGRSGKGRYFE